MNIQKDREESSKVFSGGHWDYLYSSDNKCINAGIIGLELGAKSCKLLLCTEIKREYKTKQKNGWSSCLEIHSSPMRLEVKRKKKKKDIK